MENEDHLDPRVEPLEAGAAPTGSTAASSELSQLLVGPADQYVAYEQHFIEHAANHWFTQGGTMQFGNIGEPTNADELISAILQAVRKSVHDGIPATAPPVASQPIADLGKCTTEDVIENVKCPDCDGPMVSRKNNSTGQRFWGCKAFPKCRGVRDTDGEVRTRQSVRDYSDEPEGA